MKKRQVDHVLRSAGRITGERRIVSKERLLELLGMTPVGALERERVRVMIERDFAQ